MTAETHGIAGGDRAPDGSVSYHFDAKRVLNQRQQTFENS